MLQYSRKCEHCSCLVVPRGGRPPRFCPRCGNEFPGAPVPERYPGGAGRETSGAAVWSLVLGMVALVTPVFGMFVGIGAIVAAASARSNINNASGRIGGEGIATAGFVMGIIAIIGHVALCGRIF